METPLYNLDPRVSPEISSSLIPVRVAGDPPVTHSGQRTRGRVSSFQACLSIYKQAACNLLLSLQRADLGVGLMQDTTPSVGKNMCPPEGLKLLH